MYLLGVQGSTESATIEGAAELGRNVMRGD